MKKITSLFLSLLMIMAVMSPAFAYAYDDMLYETPDAAFTYVYLSDGTVEVKNMRKYNNENITNVVIPSTVDGRNVTSIGQYACASTPGQEIRSITLPSTIKYIKIGAFSGAKITSIVIPNGVTNIQNTAFANCKSLSAVTIGKGVRTIGSGAFNSCSALKQIVIPANVTTIGQKAFYNSGLTKVTLNNGLKTIQDNAFDFTKLTSVTIPSTVTSIGFYAFCSSAMRSVTILSKTCSIYQSTATFGSTSSRIHVYAYVGSTAHKYVNKYNTSKNNLVFHAINPQKPTLSAVTPKSKSLYVKWTRPAGVTGYQVQIALNNKFTSGRKQYNIAGGTKYATTISSLYGNKRYFVRVRAYSLVNGQYRYSAWSNIRYATTKK